MTSPLSNLCSFRVLCPPGHFPSPSYNIRLPICLLRLPNQSYLHPCPDPVLLLIVPPTPSTIQGWGACPFPYHSLSLLEGCPIVSDFIAPPTRPPIEWPWALHPEPLDSTRVSSSANLHFTLSPIQRLQRYILNTSTALPPRDCGWCMWQLSALHLHSTPLWTPVSPTSNLLLLLLLLLDLSLSPKGMYIIGRWYFTPCTEAKETLYYVPIWLSLLLCICYCYTSSGGLLS